MTNVLVYRDHCALMSRCRRQMANDKFDPQRLTILNEPVVYVSMELFGHIMRQ